MSIETAAAALDLDWRMPPVREVDVLGHRIAYYERGEGPPLVLAHGFSGSAYFEWGRVFDLLAERHRVVAPQLVGFLPSEQPDIVYSTDAQLAHLSGFLEALKLTGCTLAGRVLRRLVGRRLRRSRRGARLDAGKRRPLCDPLRRGRRDPDGADPAASTPAARDPTVARDRPAASRA